MTRFQWMVLAALCCVLAGCGNDSAAGGSVSTANVGQGLTPGEFELEIVGQVSSIGPYSGDRVALRFEPSNYEASRERRDGTGGRERVTATNAEGPYSLMMRMDLQRGDEQPDRETGHVTIQLPPEARAGQTYPLETAARARHGEAFLVYGGYGQRLNIGGSGTISVAEIGDRLSVQFEFGGGDEADGTYRHIRGRAFEIPLTPRGESQYQLIIDGQREDRVDYSHFSNDSSIMVAQKMRFGFPGDVAQPGSYRLARERGPGVVALRLDDHRDLEINGTIDVSLDDGAWSASFEFEGQGDTSVRGEGRFDHVRARQAHQ